MPVLVRIAIRNLLEHKVKTLIIGIIITLGVIVLIVGNSLMDTARQGIERAFISNYTGHIMISGTAEGDVSLFGVQGPGGMLDTPVIPNYEKIRSHLSEMEQITSITSQITGFSQMSLPDTEGTVFSLLFGIEPDTYHQMFDNIEIIEGAYLSPLLEDEGIMISRDKLEDLEEEIREETAKQDEELDEEDVEIEIRVGDPIRLTSFGNAGFKIREVPLAAVYRYRANSEGLGVDLISYVDAQTLRALRGMTVGYKGEIELSDDETSLLDSGNTDDLFSEDVFSVQEAEDSAFNESELENILGDTSEREIALELDTGSWNYILAMLDNSRLIDRTVKDLNTWFEEEGINAVAGDWEKAAGPFATTADVIRTVFNIAIIIVGIVAIIIMMNTLVISVIERTAEIGTMRALGAQKGFIWKMFFTETITITLLFGFIGIVLALIIVGILNLIGIPATNVFLRVLFGGNVLRPGVSLLSILGSVFIVSGIGLLSHIYPVSVALKIQPVRAIQTE
jgi:putative ABC transport system permease protein